MKVKYLIFWDSELELFHLNLCKLNFEAVLTVNNTGSRDFSYIIFWYSNVLCYC